MFRAPQIVRRLLRFGTPNFLDGQQPSDALHLGPSNLLAILVALPALVGAGMTIRDIRSFVPDSPRAEPGFVLEASAALARAAPHLSPTQLLQGFSALAQLGQPMELETVYALVWPTARMLRHATQPDRDMLRQALTTAKVLTAAPQRVQAAIQALATFQPGGDHCAAQDAIRTLFKKKPEEQLWVLEEGKRQAPGDVDSLLAGMLPKASAMVQALSSAEEYSRRVRLGAVQGDEGKTWYSPGESWGLPDLKNAAEWDTLGEGDSGWDEDALEDLGEEVAMMGPLQERQGRAEGMKAQADVR